MKVKLSIKQQAVAEAIESLKSIQKSDDVESAHVCADDTLCGLLDQLGLHAVTAEYDKIKKWYA